MQDVRYAVHGDVHIAFREIVGDPSSDITILLISGQLIPLELMWDDPGHARFIDGLAAMGRLVVFDRRGIGMSDPIANWDEPVLEQWVDDAVSVLDAAGLESAHVVGWEQGGAVAFRLAVDHPSRVSGLVVFNGLDRVDRMEAIDGQSAAARAASMEHWIETGETTDVLPSDVYSYSVSRSGDVSLRKWLEQAGRLGASPTTASRIWHSIFTDTSSVDLTNLTCPAMLLWRRDNEVLDREIGRAIAADYPHIEYVELPGADFAPYGGDIDGLVSEIERFVTGEASRVAASDRHLSAVLFTDIVGSTELASSSGDGVWRGTLDAHDRIVERVMSRHGGELVKQTGDGAMVCFALASRAVRAATELREELRGIDLSVRQGIHVGEIVVRGDDVSGVAVHMAARVMDLAEAGEVLTSAVVPMVVEGDSFEFEKRSEVELRGLGGVRHIYVVSGAA